MVPALVSVDLTAMDPDVNGLLDPSSVPIGILIKDLYPIIINAVITVLSMCGDCRVRPLVLNYSGFENYSGSA